MSRFSVYLFLWSNKQTRSSSNLTQGIWLNFRLTFKQQFSGFRIRTFGRGCPPHIPTVCPSPGMMVLKGLTANPDVMVSPFSSVLIPMGWLRDGLIQTGQAWGLALSLSTLCSDLIPGLRHCCSLLYKILRTLPRLPPTPNTLSYSKPP